MGCVTHNDLGGVHYLASASDPYRSLNRKPQISPQYAPDAASRMENWHRFNGVPPARGVYWRDGELRLHLPLTNGLSGSHLNSDGDAL